MQHQDWFWIYPAWGLACIISGVLSAYHVGKSYNLEFDRFGKVLSWPSRLILIVAAGLVGFVLFLFGSWMWIPCLWMWIPCLIVLIAISIVQIIGTIRDVGARQNNDVMDPDIGKEAEERVAGTAVLIRALWFFGYIPAVVGFVASIYTAKGISETNGSLELGAPLVILLTILVIACHIASSSYRFYSLQQDQTKKVAIVVSFIICIIVLSLFLWYFVIVAMMHR